MSCVRRVGDWYRLVTLGFVLLAGGLPARASFHFMQIEQVIGGVNGDTTVQAIQLRMRSAGQQFVSGAKLIAYDANGANPVLLIQFPSSASSGSSGSRILIATSNFAQYTTPSVAPDFTLSAVIPPSYLAAGKITYTNSTGGVLWSLACGGANYAGSDTGLTTNDSDGNFAPAFASPLPSTSTAALLFQGSASALSTTNAADYASTGSAATFTNNAGASGSVTAGSTSLPPIPKGNIRVGLQSIARGLAAPVDLLPTADGTGRLLIVDQIGQVRLVKDGKLLATPLLDVSSRLVAIDPVYDERGLLGLALHPGFANPASPGYHKLYTYTSEPVAGTADFPVTMTGSPDHQSVIAEWQISAANPDAIDPASRREVLRIDEPQSNHNGGKLAFRPSDGYLYISLGDGGGQYDTADGHGTSGNGQNTGVVLGKILRIDPIDPSLTQTSSDAASANGKYRVPSSNPFVGVAGADEIYAIGFRNPYRFSFDTGSGRDRLIVGDVGQDHVEEVDVVENGKNYGWHLKEGKFLYDPVNNAISADANPDPALIDPVLEYSHTDGNAVIGGYVYRGSAIPELADSYVFGDFTNEANPPTGRLFYGDLQNKTIAEFNLGLGDDPLGRYLKGFGQDENGELYVLTSIGIGPAGTSGQVLKLVPQSLSAVAIGDTVPGGGGTYATITTPQVGAFAGAVNANGKRIPTVFAAQGNAVLSVGQSVTGLPDSVIQKLGNPIGDAALVTLKVGPGSVAATTNTVLVAGLTAGAPRIAARTGTSQTGLPAGVTIKRFGSIDGNGATVFFFATLQGTGIAPSASSALCAALGDGSVRVLAKVGDSVGGQQIATIASLVGSKGTLAEGRWRVDDHTCGVRFTFAGKGKPQAIYTIPDTANTPADWTSLTGTGPATAIPTIPGTTITSFGLPGFGPQSFATNANLTPATSMDNVALITGDSSAVKVLRRKGAAIAADADGTPLTNVTIKTLSDPAVGGNGRVAYLVTANGKGFGTGIEYSENGTSTAVLANTGATAPGGGHWASFSSLALPNGSAAGPLFTAKLASSKTDQVSGSNNFGLWGVDSIGNLQLLLRTNQRVFVAGATRTVKSFVTLAPAAGSSGVASGYDDRGNVAVFATFTDGTKAMLKLVVP